MGSSRLQTNKKKNIDSLKNNVLPESSNSSKYFEHVLHNCNYLIVFLKNTTLKSNYHFNLNNMYTLVHNNTIVINELKT